MKPFLLAATIGAAAQAAEITLHGSGTTNPSKFYWDIMSKFEARAKPQVKMSYRAVGSGTGLTEFTGADQGFEPYADFGSGDIPVDATRYGDLTTAGETVLHVPFNLGAMSFFYNVPGGPAEGLKFTSCILADIFNRVITTWDHPDIVDLNPGLAVPPNQEISVFHRVLGSSTTAGITQYLNNDCPTKWPSSLVGSSITWADGTFPADGSGLMSDAILATPFSIGYVDSGHGHDNGLTEIELANLNGVFQTSKTAIASGGVKAAAEEALTAGIVPTEPSADFSGVSLHNQPGDTTWPIVAISYIWVRKDQTGNGETAALLKAFLEYILSPAGQELLPEYGFEGLPTAILDVAETAVSELDLPPAATEWTFEISTSAGAGQEDYVISEKRRSYDNYAIEELFEEKAESSVVESLIAEVAELKSMAAIALHGSGTTNPSKFYWDIMALFEARAKPPVKMTYRAVGSGTGLTEFTGADQDFTPYADFGSGDIPVDATRYGDLNDAGETVLHVPFNLGAMSFFYNVPGAPAAGLKFTSCVLADIFNRVITTWDHEDITALNPTLTVPAGQEISAFHRVLGSSTTAGITQYLNNDCPAKWPSSLVGSSIDWADGTFEADGSGLMSDAILSTMYSIGYVDSGHGHDNGLTEIELKNLDGFFQTSKTAIAAGGVKAAAEEALTAGIVPTEPSADFSGVSLHNQPGETTWPIVAISYIWVRKDQTGNGETAALLKAFLEYILSPAGQELLPEYGFEGLPTAILNVAETAVAELELADDVAEWTFETSTSAGAGQEDYVISEKRRSYDNYAIAELFEEKAEVSAVAALEARLMELEELIPATLHGSGTTNPSKFYWDIMALFEARAKPGVKMSYRAVGSGTGLHEFIGADQSMMPYADFGSGDIPVDKDSYDSLIAAGHEVLHFPFNLGAMSFFYNVPGAPTEGLKFTACVLARVFSRAITRWDDSEILGLNPGFSPPQGQSISVYHRVLGSSTTAGVTTYLNDACPTEWPAANVGSSITWASGTFEADGSGLMSDAILATDYSIGYVDSGHGHDNGLTEIELANAAGTFQTSKTAIAAGGVQAAADRALQLGVLPSDPKADFSGVSLHNMAGANTWPIVAVSYIWIRADQSGKGRTAALLVAFLEYILSDAGQALVSTYGFEPVPTAILDVAQLGLDEIIMPSVTKWTFETSTVKGGGQVDYVISEKRRSYDNYAISELFDEKAESTTVATVEAMLFDQIEAVETEVATVKADVLTLSNGGVVVDPVSGGVGEENDDDAKKDANLAMIIAIVGLILGLLAFIMAAYAVCKLGSANNPRNIGDKDEVCIPAVKPSAQAYADLSLQHPNDQL